MSAGSWTCIHPVCPVTSAQTKCVLRQLGFFPFLPPFPERTLISGSYRSLL